MKKLFLLMAATALVFAGCKEDPKTPEPAPEEDFISVAPGSKSFTSAGGEVPAVVTSSGTWTVSGGESWAHPSATSGANGDPVVFTVDANTGEAAREAVFTFECGEATDTFRIEVAGAGPVSTTKFDLVGEDEVTVSNKKGSVEIILDTEVAYRDLAQNVTILSGDGDWLVYTTKSMGAGDDYVHVFFSCAANTSFENREAEVTISGGDASVNVKVVQSQTDRLVVAETRLLAAAEGEVVNVELTTNVEYDVAIDDDAKSWLSMGTTSEAGGVITIPFTAAALGESEPSRSAEITITQKNGTLSQIVTITQSGSALVNMAANMNKNWAWVPDWPAPTPLANMTTFTFEVLVNANTFTKSLETHGSASPINVIAGIEAKFLIRFGDVGVATNAMQVVYPSSGTELKRTSTTRFSTGEWYHIAVVFASTSATSSERFGKVYINGAEETTLAATPARNQAVNFSERVIGDEVGWGYPRRFWFGYAWDADRFFDGLISEARIWNKVLTPAEINAENHFYSVEPDAPGLVAYWKFNDNLTGTSNVVKDYTSNANHMSTSKDVTWTPVALP